MSESVARDIAPDVWDVIGGDLCGVECELDAHVEPCGFRAIAVGLAELRTENARLRVKVMDTIADAIEAMNGQARDCGCSERIKADFMKDRA